LTPDDGPIRPKHVIERQGDNKRIALWTEIYCMKNNGMNIYVVIVISKLQNKGKKELYEPHT
jgi:hypothetical protein